MVSRYLPRALPTSRPPNQSHSAEQYYVIVDCRIYNVDAMWQLIAVKKLAE